MIQCKWCDKHIFWMFSRRDCLCRSCRAEITADIERILPAVKYSIKVVANAANRSLRIEHCRTILEHAERLQAYARRGIPVGDFQPDRLIEEYRNAHDSLITEQHPKRRYLSVSCARAEDALAEYQDILHVRDALDSIRLAREIAPDIKPSAVISFINQKGGVGKTTSTLNLGAGLARQNRRVLLIDFDPQANLTDGLGLDETKLTSSIFDVLTGKVTARDAVITLNDRMAVIPADISLSRAERELARQSSNIYLLKNAIETIEGYDAVLIDCPPSLGVLTLNALAASNSMIVPVQPEYYALKGLRKVFDALNFVNRKINHDLRIMGIVGTRYDPRKNLHVEVLDRLKAGMKNGAFFTIIRENIAVAEASSFGQSIFDYSPDSSGAEDYQLLSREVMNAIEKYG